MATINQLKNLNLATEGHMLYSYEPISSPFQRFARYNFSDNSFPKDVIILITFSKKLYQVKQNLATRQMYIHRQEL